MSKITILTIAVIALTGCSGAVQIHGNDLTTDTNSIPKIIETQESIVVDKQTESVPTKSNQYNRFVKDKEYPTLAIADNDPRITNSFLIFPASSRSSSDTFDLVIFTDGNVGIWSNYNVGNNIIEVEGKAIYSGEYSLYSPVGKIEDRAFDLNVDFGAKTIHYNEIIDGHVFDTLSFRRQHNERIENFIGRCDVENGIAFASICSYDVIIPVVSDITISGNFNNGVVTGKVQFEYCHGAPCSSTRPFSADMIGAIGDERAIGVFTSKQIHGGFVTTRKSD